MNHPNIASIRHVIIDRKTITTVSDYHNAPKLFSFICSQRQYLSEKIIS